MCFSFSNSHRHVYSSYITASLSQAKIVAYKKGFKCATPNWPIFLFKSIYCALPSPEGEGELGGSTVHYYSIPFYYV